MWLFWIMWACVCAPASLVFVLVHARTHVRVSASAYVCASVLVCLCRSIKFCSHSCRLVSAWLWSVCLPLNLQPLLLFHSLSSFLLTFSSASLCSASLCCSLFLSFLPNRFTVFFFFHGISSCLSPSMPSPSLPLSYSTPCFSLALLSISQLHSGCFHLSTIPS